MPESNGETSVEYLQGLVDEATIKSDKKLIQMEVKLRQERKKVKTLEKDRDDALVQYKDLLEAKLPIAGKFKKPDKKDGFLRIVFGDIHGMLMDKKAVNALLNDLEILKPGELVCMGDLVECGGFLAKHHTLGYVAQTTYTYQEDITVGNWVLDEIQKRCPEADFHYLEGNHEDRVEKWIIDQVEKNSRDAYYLRSLNSPEFLLRCKERGIKYYRRGEKYGGIDQPGMIKLGKIFFAHQLSGARHAAAQSLSQVAGNLVYGHTHRTDSSTSVYPSVGLVKAWNPGCLCTLQPLWRHANPTNWSHGYGVEFVQDNGEFMHINVPIWKGKSLLGNLGRMLG